MSAIKNLLALVLGVGLLLWVGARIMLDAIQRTVAVDDFAQLDRYVATVLALLLKAPWWVPAALASALFVVHLFRGRSPVRADATLAAPDAAEDEPAEEDEAPEQQEEHLVPIHEAIDHIAKCIDDSVTQDCFSAARGALRQHASEGTVRMRGRRQIDDPTKDMAYSEAETQIPKDYWTISTIGPMAVDANFLDSGHTFPEPVNAWGRRGLFEKKGYSRVRVDWDDIVKLWPGTA
jgi:hypothetical protein